MGLGRSSGWKLKSAKFNLEIRCREGDWKSFPEVGVNLSSLGVIKTGCALTQGDKELGRMQDSMGDVL